MSAKDTIDEGIRQFAKSSGMEGVVTGWIAIVATVGHDGEEDTSGIMTIYPPGSMPWHTALGLVEAARIRMHAEFAAAE
ncbi:MAG TPA: hypothetical protein VF174_10025 [Micromonosporaceae bacterium]